MIKFKHILNENVTFSNVSNEITSRFSKYYELSLAGIKSELRKIELFLTDIKNELSEAHGESYANSIMIEYGAEFDSWQSVTVLIYYPVKYKNELGKWIDVTNGNTGVDVNLVAERLTSTHNLRLAKIHPWTRDVKQGIEVLRQTLEISPPRIQYRKP